MTIGSRIAQKRKESGLSQEALGEQLGLSRQSVYKWESDGALPEIDKLIALSRLFGVSVGWLLGVEEEESGTEHIANDGELTESQLKMVEEIVARYLAAQSVPAPKKRRTLFKICIAAAGVCLAFGLYSLSGKLDTLNNQYNNLHHSVSTLQSNVNSQIGGISNRVEEILKAQNALTADYGAEIAATDLARNTVTFSVRAVPKTFQEGMDAVFLADCGDGPAEFPAELTPGRTFTGEITVEMTDSITLSVVFISPDGTRQTQLLDTFEYLYTSTIPDNYSIMGGNLIFKEVKDGKLVLKDNDRYVTVVLHPEAGNAYYRDVPVAKIGSIRVALCRDRTVIKWLEPCEIPENFHGYDEKEDLFFQLPYEGVTMDISEGQTVTFAAFVTDEHGRVTVTCEHPCTIGSDGRLTYENVQSWSLRSQPDEWEY